MPHYDYAVRITHSYEVCKAIIDTWSQRCEKMLVYEHNELGKKVHIHMVITRSDTEKKWLRELGARTGVNLKGNENCSFKKFDGNKTAIVYMTKGINDPKFNKGYSEEDIALWKSQWEQKPASKDAALYEQVFGDAEYNEELYKEWTREYPMDAMDMYHKYKWVKSLAYKSVLLRNGYIVNLKAINQYKMLVYSYCAVTDIRIPDDDRTFKQMG